MHSHTPVSHIAQHNLMPNILMRSNVLQCNQEVFTYNIWYIISSWITEFKSQRNNGNQTRWYGIGTTLMTSCGQNLKNQSFVLWHLLEVLDANVAEESAVSFFRITANITCMHSYIDTYIHSYTHTYIQTHTHKHTHKFHFTNPKLVGTVEY